MEYIDLLLLRTKIGKTRMVEGIGYPGRVMLQFPHKRLNLMRDVFRSVGQLACMYRNLQSVIQIFVRVVFRSIGRQEKHIHMIFLLFQPGRHKLAMMDLQIVQNQEHFPFRAADQTLQEADQALLVHGVLINHKTNFPLTADRRDPIDSLSFRFHWQHWRTTLG